MILAISASAAHAVALSDQVVEQMRADGTLDTYIAHIKELRAQGMDQPVEKPNQSSLALGGQEFKTQNILVLLIDFYDRPYTAGYDSALPADFDSMLFSDSENPTGSMKNFYYENSYGKYIIQGDVYGWYHAPGTALEYAENGNSLVMSAVQQADADVDFSKYDNDGDGIVDGVIVVHAGTGREESGYASDIHSYMSTLQPPTTLDGVAIGPYTLQPEESKSSQSMSAIGVFCHEWGHILGLIDLYDTDYSCSGVGKWSLMAAGNYNGASKLPSHLDAWSKFYLGWVQPINVTSTTFAAEIPAVEFNPVVYRLTKGGSIGVTQYWLVENRYWTGFDAALPAPGLLIYHIDESVGSNNNDWHPRVFVEQADGLFNLQAYANPNNGDGGDPWPYGEKRQFHDKTTPNSKYYVGSSSEVGVWNISDRDSVMTADFEVNFTRPWVESSGFVLRDNVHGDNDGVPEAGEKIQLVLSLVNDWAEASDISVTMTCDDPAIEITVGTAPFPSVSMGGTSSNNDLPFEFQIPEDYASRVDSFYFDLTSNGDTYHIQVAGEANIGRPQILIVDDDDDDPKVIEQYMALPFHDKRTPIDMWHINFTGSPTAFDLNNYHTVIWLTGPVRDFILNSDDVEAMKGFMDAGGNLFLTGQGIAGQLSVQDPDFMANYLKTTYVSDTAYGVIPVIFPTGGPVSVDMENIVIGGNSGANNQTVYDHILPVNGGVGELYYMSPRNDFGAVSYSGDYKSVFFSFGYEAIKSDDSDRFETRASVMARIMAFFGDLPTDVNDPSQSAINLPSRFSLAQNYPNPFNPVTTINYVITGAGPRVDRTRLDIFNILGQCIRTLVNREEVPGQYSVVWDGRDESGLETASGLYFYRISRGGQEETRKMILLK